MFRTSGLLWLAMFNCESLGVAAEGGRAAKLPPSITGNFAAFMPQTHFTAALP